MGSQIFESAIFFIPLALPKVLPFGNKNKLGFILYFAHLFVPLSP